MRLFSAARCVFQRARPTFFKLYLSRGILDALPMLEGSFVSPVSRCDVFLLPFNDDSWRRCYVGRGEDVVRVFPVFELCGLTEVGEGNSGEGWVQGRTPARQSSEAIRPVPDTNL